MDAEYLRECLDYSPETGVFIWNTRPLSHFKNEAGRNTFNAQCAGKKAGSLKKSGYWKINFNGKYYSSHRLAYLYMTGYMPLLPIDHINHDGSDNRWCNLRLVTDAENQKNRKLNKNNTSGFNGVYWRKNEKKWCVIAKINGKKINIGLYPDISSAATARKLFDNANGFHRNHGDSALPAIFRSGL
jgi:hypothetical protein